MEAEGVHLDRWTRVWRGAGLTGDPAPVYQDLLARHSEPHRHYHNTRHLAQCFAELDSVCQWAGNPAALELAVWFHDAIYDPRASDNEKRSAELASARIGEAGGDAALIQEVAELIMATRNHDSSAHPDAPWMVDVDSSILGQDAATFQNYEAQI